jgi:beta-galactosidase
VETLSAGAAAEVELQASDGRLALARSGDCFYLAGWPDELLLRDILRICLARAGAPAIPLHADLRIRDNGSRRYFFNYGREAIDIGALLGDSVVLMGDALLPPYGVVVAQRRHEVQPPPVP